MTAPEVPPSRMPEPLTLANTQPHELENGPRTSPIESTNIVDRYQRLLETISDYVYTVRIENDHVVETQHGPACIAVTGYSAQEFADDPLLWIQMVHPADRELVGDLGRRILAGEEVTAIEHRILHKNGAQRWVSNTPILKYDVSRRLVGYDGIVRDITDYKRSVLALQEAREQQQRAGQLITTILSHTFMVALYLDTEGNCLWVNEAFARNSGQASSYFPGKNLFTLHPELSIRTSFAQVVKTGEPLFGAALALVFPDQPERGTTYWDYSLYPISDATQTMIGLVLTMAEVTSRVRMEEQIRASELRYRTVANYTYDWETWETEDGRLSYCSPSCLRVTGHYPEEFINQKELLDSLVFDEDRSSWSEYRQAIRQSNVPRQVDFRIRKPDGKVCWLNQRCAPVTSEDGTALGWRASTQDITDRKRFELQLRTQAELLNLSPVNITVYDEQGRYSYVNQQALDIHGYTRDEFLALTVPDMAVESGTFNFREHVHNLRRDGTTTFQAQHRRKDGTLITLWTAAKATQLDGQLMVLSVGTDITERERAANALAQSESTLRALFEAVGESVYLVDPKGEIVTSNAVAATRLGTTPSQMIRRSIFEFIPETLHDSRRRVLEEVVRTSRIMRFEDVRDGRFIEHSVYPVTDQTGAVGRVAIFARDVTEHWLAENRLRKTNEFLLSLRDAQSRFMNTGDPQPVYSTLLDALVGLSESKFGYLERIADASSQRTLALVDLSDDKNTSLIYTQVSAALASLANITDAGRAQPLNGGSVGTAKTNDVVVDSFLGIPLVYGGQLVGVVGLANRSGGFDASIVEVLAPFTTTCAATIHAVETMQLYRAQRVLLHDSEEAKRAIVETVPGVVYRISVGSQPRLVHVSAGSVPITGYSFEELASAEFDWSSLVILEDLPRLREVLNTVIQTGKPSEVEFRLRDKSGAIHWFHTKYQLTDTGLDQPKYVDGVAIDISERRRAQNALAEKTEELERYFTVSLDLICIADLQGYIRRINSAWNQTLGYDLGELVGTNLITFVHPDDTASTRQAIEQLAAQRPIMALTNRLRHRNGSYRYVEWHAHLSDNAIYAAARDVTARILAESALKESEARYRVLVENTPDVVTHFDENGEILYVSPSVAQVCDFSAEQLVGKTYLTAGFPAEDARLWLARIRRVVTTGVPDEAEINFESTRHGAVVLNWRLFPVRDTRERRTVLSLARNVTEQKRLEREYQALFNEMLDGLALHRLIGSDTTRPESFQLLAVNPAFERMTGRIGEDLLGKTLLDVLPHTEPRWLEIYGQVASTGTPAHFEAHFADLGRLYEVTAFRSAPKQVACIYTDISERRRIQEQYHQSAKLEAIGRLASGVAHDLNNLLMPILGNSDVVLEMTEPDDARVTPLREIRTAAQQAKGLVRQLLAFGRKQRLDVHNVDLNTVVSTYALLLERALRENVRFSLVTSPTPLPVSADVGQLELVLLTLVVNAQDSMPNGGTLTIRLFPSPISGSTETSDNHPPLTEACMTVRDSGFGLDPGTRERIFEPFFTTRTKTETTYLGLSTIHAIIAQHGGFITVQSTPGLGTEFTIRLPLVSSTVTTEPGSDIPHPLSQLRGHGSLLVVEDNALVRDLTVRALEMQGYRVHSASNAKECLAKIEDWSEQFDLLLTDLVMPDMNGKALFEVLNARFEHLRVIYMSGYSRAFITQQHGIDEDVPFLQKPFSIQKLLSTLRQLLATES